MGLEKDNARHDKDGISQGLQRWDTARQFGPVAADGLFDEFLYSVEGRCWHHHLPDKGHVLTIVLPQKRE